MTDDVEIRIFVEQLDSGAYEVVTSKDGKPWLRHGPYDDLDYASMICREMLQRADALLKRLTQKT
jgi:hypothetical protein